MPYRIKNTWYVSFDLPKTSQLHGRQTVRTTKTFHDESAARDFARVKFAEGLRVNAGTINPYMPKRVIASTEIYNWLELGQANASPSFPANFGQSQ
jgi:hypothetical protein